MMAVYLAHGCVSLSGGGGCVLGTFLTRILRITDSHAFSVQNWPANSTDQAFYSRSCSF